MNCQECLEQLATVSLREMQPDSVVMQHCATCPDCAALTTRLREREYNAATILNGLPPLSSPLSLAETSATLARRRRVGRMVVAVSGIAGAIIIGLVSSTMLVPWTVWRGIGGSPSLRGLRTETITLTCLSPEQAADIINPYVRSRGSVYYTPSSNISVITVRGTAEEIARSRELIDGLENDPAAACHHPIGADMTDFEKMGEQLSGMAPVIAGTPVGTPPSASPDPAPKPSRARR